MMPLAFAWSTRSWIEVSVMIFEMAASMRIHMSMEVHVSALSQVILPFLRQGTGDMPPSVALTTSATVISDAGLLRT